MKIFFPATLLFLVLASNVFSQTIRPSAVPTPPADDDVVKISTSLIQIDATVTDKSGKIITDLKPEEVEI